MNWWFCPLKYISGDEAPQGEEPPPPPPPPPSTEWATPTDVALARDAVLGQLGIVRNEILAACSDLNKAVVLTKNEILTAIAGLKFTGDWAKLTDLAAAKAEILAAIADIQTTPPPSTDAGYAMVGSVKYTDLRQAALAVSDGGVVEIYGVMSDLNASAGFLNGCTIRGMTPDAKLEWTLGTAERMAFGKGLIVCTGVGKTYVVENLELTGARVVDRNGAGVRGDLAASVTIQNCNIHDNENGVLSIADRLFLYGNTIKNNGNTVGNAHGVYVNTTSVLEVVAEGNTFHAALIGNQFKSRAKKTVFRQNTVAELGGSCSWQIDLSNGGDCLIEKNIIEQGPNAQNRNIVSYGPEGLTADGRVNNLAFRDNWVINDHALDSWGLNIFNLPNTLEIARNTFVGRFAAPVVNATPDSTNLIHADRAAAGLAAYPALPEVPA
jgi:hypothetical protein